MSKRTGCVVFLVAVTAAITALAADELSIPASPPTEFPQLASVTRTWICNGFVFGMPIGLEHPPEATIHRFVAVGGRRLPVTAVPPMAR